MFHFLAIFLFKLISITECATITQTVPFIYKSDLTFNCSTINANVSFYKTDSHGNISRISPDQSKYILDATSTVLTVKSAKKADVKSKYFCNSTNGDTINFEGLVAPHLYIVDALSVSTAEGFSADLACYLICGTENGQVNWTWIFKNQILEPGDKYSIDNSQNTSSKLTIKSIKLVDKGDYLCEASNQYGSHSRNTTLRVKSSLAPLWPFLGVVGEVSLLALFITIYELKFRVKDDSKKKDQKIAVQDAANEDDQGYQLRLLGEHAFSFAKH